jgi:Carboxypeptidase regulatory-like domain
MSAHRAAFRLAIVLAAGAGLGQPPAGQNFRISGTVVNALSGQPLSHTQVAIGLPQNGAAQAMITAEDGHFAFENLRAGNTGWRQSTRDSRGRLLMNTKVFQPPLLLGRI